LSWGPAPSATEFAVTAVGPLPSDALSAIEASGGRVLDALDWGALDEQPLGGLLIVAAVPGDIGQGALERLATLLQDEGLAAVIAFEQEAMDAVAGSLMGPRVELLCDPSPVDWAIALVLARQRTGTVPAGVREGGDEGERLRRLNEEVARIAVLLAGLVEDRSASVDTVDDRRRGYGGEPPAEVAIDAAEIRRTIRARRMRAQFFDARLLEDPGWDMLLDLFAAELEGIQVSVSSLCIAAAVAPTTALRWITRMAEAGLMARVADAGDRRRAFVGLSGQGSVAMRGYVAAVKRAGLAVV
jgi:DNA-binding MarR family transcriptional regulator